MDNPGKNADTDGLPDVSKVRDLAALMVEFDLSQISYRNGDAELRIKRGITTGIPAPAAYPHLMVAPSAPSPSVGSSVSSAPPAAAASATEGRNIEYIRSPMVGTFYSKPNPAAEPFVKVGDHVDPERTICIIEAMKVFNEIPAEMRGRIVAVLVGDEESVEFGKPLFKVDTSG
ncbi:MAG: acetyl-CoA carboxylase biotin carboxyl carrier protein [Planctomycetes bacterium]|nr:acetyl-CoA carboxylase biotin carboxyl carrier protein [Planctomycetota bacterium]